MKIGGKTYIENVYFFLFKHFIKIGVAALFGIFLHLLGANIAQRHKLGIRH